MAYQHEAHLTKKAQEFIARLSQAEFMASIVPGSMREFSLKISVTKNQHLLGNVVLYYSPKKDNFSLKYNEMKDHSFDAKLERVWQDSHQPIDATLQPENDVEIYVDGSFLNDAIGYGVVVVQNNTVIKEVSNQVPTADDLTLLQSRQVAGEIYGVRAAVSCCKENHISSVTIAYDYEGLQKWATGQWRAKQPLTQEYADFIQTCGINITWRKVAAHTGQRWNERADQLARETITSTAPAVENQLDPISLITQKADQFVEFLQNRGITATFDGLYNNQYARLIVFEQGCETGVCDLYNTKKRPLSSPYWHNFSNPVKQQEFENLWREFFAGDKSPATPGPALALLEVEYYNNILKPYADCAFDFIDLAQAIARAAVNQPIPVASFDLETARYDFEKLKTIYETLRNNTHV